MPGDINATGLSIALQLDTVLASKGLTLLIDQVKDFEGDLADAAAAALKSTNTLADASQAVIKDFTGLQTSVMENYTKGYVQISKQVLERQKDLNLVKQHEKELRKRLLLTQELMVVTEMIQKESKREFDTAKSVNNAISQTEKSIYLKNKAHRQQNDLMSVGDRIAKAIWHTHKWMGDEVKRIATNLVGQLTALMSIARVWGNMVQDTERFVTANYRAYGSQVQMVAESYRLAGAYGLAREKALEAYQAMADLRTPRDEMEKMTVSVARFHRVTGVGIDVTAKFVKTLRSIGYSSAESERSLTGLANKMRQMNLTTAEMNKVVGELPNAFLFEKVFGKDTFDNFTQMRAELAGLGKAMSVNSDAILNWTNQLGAANLEGEVFRQGIAQSLGISLEDAKDLEKVFGAAGAKAMEMYDAQLAAGQTQGVASAAATKYLSVALKMNEEQAAFVWQLYETQKALGVTTNDLGDLAKAMGMLMDDIVTLDKLFGEAGETITQSLREIESAFDSIFAVILEPMMPVVIGGLEVIAFVLGKIGDAAQWVSAQLKFMKESSNSFVSFLGHGLQLIIGLLFIMSFRLFGVFTWLGRLIGLIPGLGTAATSAGATITNVFRGVFTAIQQLIVGIFTTIGQALRALLTPVNGLKGAMLVMSVFMLAVAASIWIVAQAIKTVAEVGDAAGQAVLYLAAGTAVLIVAIGALAAIATVASAPLLTLGIAILPLSVGMLILSGATIIAAKAFEIFANAMIKLVDERFLPRFAEQLVEAASTIFSGSTELIVAAGVLAIASAELVVAVGALGIAAAMLVPTAAGLLVGGGVMVAAGGVLYLSSSILSAAADMLHPASTKLMESSANLLRAVPDMLLAVGGLLAVGTGLAGASVILGAGVAAMAIPLWGLGRVVAYLAKIAPDMILSSNSLRTFGKALEDLNLSADSLIRVNAGLADFIAVSAGVYDASLTLSGAMSNVRYSIESLYHVNFFYLVNYIRYWTDQIFEAFRDITRIDFDSIAVKLESGISRIAKVFGQLSNVQIKTDLEALQGMLTEYTQYMEVLATKLEAISKERIAPIVKGLRDDIKETIEAEAFHTVKVMHTTQDSRDDRLDKLVALQEQNNLLILALSEIVKTKDGGENVKGIHDLLREHLPELAEGKSSSDGMASDMVKNWVT